VGTLIADEDGVYDPRLANDRFFSDEGTMSEMELSILRQRAMRRSTEGPARRVFMTVAVATFVAGPTGSR